MARVVSSRRPRWGRAPAALGRDIKWHRLVLEDSEDQDHQRVHGVPMRRLFEAEAERMLSSSIPALKKFKERWDSQVKQHGVGCNKRDLSFKLGTGLLMRGKDRGP